jgi:hypothetical protein
LPQLLELFAPDFLVNFLKDIGHRMVLAWFSPSRVIGRAWAAPQGPRCRLLGPLADTLSIWRRQGKTRRQTSLSS